MPKNTIVTISYVIVMVTACICGAGWFLAERKASNIAKRNSRIERLIRESDKQTAEIKKRNRQSQETIISLQEKIRKQRAEYKRRLSEIEKAATGAGKTNTEIGEYLREAKKRAERLERILQGEGNGA